MSRPGRRARVIYWVAGLPVALRYRRRRAKGDALDEIRAEYARQYWHPRRAAQAEARNRALRLWPWFLVRQMRHFTRLNGKRVAAAHSRSPLQQMRDQLRVYGRHGILPRWYYIFSLFEPGALDRARYFLNRFETKPILFAYLNNPGTSPLGNKVAFARRCAKHRVPHVPLLLIAEQGRVEAVDAATPTELPPTDLFIKPVRARGGTGAERWEWTGEGYRHAQRDETLSAEALVERLRRDSTGTPRLVQPRVSNHGAIADLTQGALSTARVLTCLDEQGEPELIAAVFRMAIGRDSIVDNIHAGGIAAGVDVESGRLGPASNLGEDVRLGWLTAHPDTGARIEGRQLPFWPEVRTLVRDAHRAFHDRIIIGWDVALLGDGPCLVEGNTGPDVDLMQRPVKRGLGEGRLPELLAFHLRQRRKLPD